jgi:hypothetical protein
MAWASISDIKHLEPIMKRRQFLQAAGLGLATTAVAKPAMRSAWAQQGAGGCLPGLPLGCLST